MAEPLAPRAPGDHPPALTPAYRSTRARAPSQPLVALASTLTEETGPVFAPTALGPLDHDLVQNWGTGRALGERILVHGRVLDGAAQPVAGTLVEIWQANAAGRYRHKADGYDAPLDPDFGGGGRTLTGADGRFSFFTIRPGAYPWPNGGNDWRPAHIHFSVFGHAFGQRLTTQMYFEGDPLIPLCPIANAVADRAHLDTLIARLDMEASRPMDHLAYRFDIVLRGPRQSVFENRPEGT
jgi:protocatechuate 3,4-dioxygenase beta subunit